MKKRQRKRIKEKPSIFERIESHIAVLVLQSFLLAERISDWLYKT